MITDNERHAHAQAPIDRITAAGRIIDIMSGGNLNWRSRINESDFLESADWLTALAYADAALIGQTRPAVRQINETARDWDVCGAVDAYRSRRNEGDERTLSDFLAEKGIALSSADRGSK